MEFSIRTKLWYHGDELSIYGVYPIAFLKQNVLKHLYDDFFLPEIITQIPIRNTQSTIPRYIFEFKFMSIQLWMVQIK